MSGTPGAMQAGEKSEPEHLSLADIFKRYKDQWVALAVTARDKNFQPTRGKVMENDIDRYRLRQKLLKYPDICIFFAGEPPYPLLL